MLAGVLVSLVAAACTSTTSPTSQAPASTSPTIATTTTTEPEPPPIDLSSLTEFYGCGNGFHVANADQTMGLFVRLDRTYLEGKGLTYYDSNGIRTTTPLLPVQVPAQEWEGEIRFGRDLFDNWCNDFGPWEPFERERWPIVGGILTFTALVRSAEATLVGLVVEQPDGTVVVLGDIVLVNPGWDLVAG